MINTMMTMNLILASLFIMMEHPISMGTILMLQTITTSILLGYMAMNFWFSYILFLILVGGMLILFIYMTSVASNEKFNLSIKTLMTIPLILLLPLINITIMPQENMKNQESYLMNNPFLFDQSLLKFMNYPGLYLLMFMIIYLLITLIASVKITNISHGPLRIKN